MKQDGFLILIDMTGYTRFLTQASLEAANTVMNELFETLMEKVQAPLIISKLEGDAIFAYAPDGSFMQPQTLLEALDNIYYAFRRKLEFLINNGGSEELNALIAELDLKFIVHHGEYVISKIGDYDELNGTDVVLAHRLGKNTITDTTGVKAYAYFTDAATTAMTMGELAIGMFWHIENYDFLGDVAGYVYDLTPSWQVRRLLQREVVSEAELWFRIDVDVPISPALAWDYLHEPEHKRVWSQSDTLILNTKEIGRVGVGAEHQCFHGDQCFTHTIVDWRPFQYATFDLTGPLGSTIRYSTEVHQNGTGTHIAWKWAKPTGDNVLHDSLVKLLSPAMRQFLEVPARQTAEVLQSMVKQDIDQGRVSTFPSIPMPTQIRPSYA